MAYKKHAKSPPLSFSKQVLKMKEPGTVEELQEALRLSRIKIELLETMIDISDEQFGTDIRKKAGPGSHEIRTKPGLQFSSAMFTVWS